MEKENYEIAIKEWYFNHEVIDNNEFADGDISRPLLNDLCKINRNMEQNNMFIESWTQLKVNGTIEPKLALFLINNFIENNIDYTRIDMKIDVKRKICKDQINKMSKNNYNLIRALLEEKNEKQKYPLA